MPHRPSTSRPTPSPSRPISAAHGAPLPGAATARWAPRWPPCGCALGVGLGTAGTSRPVTAPGTSATTAAATQLVAYTGPQFDHYTVDDVPRGWVVQGADATSLVVGPAGSAAPASPAPGAAVSVEGKILVTLESSAVGGKALPDSVAVSVGTATGSWGRYLGTGDYHGLRYADGDHLVEIQVPASLHWTATDAARFAVGVHVPADAEARNG
jgi:hypothetical protein